MEKLEVLSLGSNLIEDFSDYPRLPNLAVLSVRDNKIASFKGFPCSPSLTVSCLMSLSHNLSLFFSLVYLCPCVFGSACCI